MTMTTSVLFVFLLCITSVSAFHPLSLPSSRPKTVSRSALGDAEPKTQEKQCLQTIFDFSDSTRNETDRFERIDDVIMGGISTSSLRQVDGEPFARWSGVCREDGG